MKKLLSLLLALILVLSTVPALAEAAPVEDDAQLPRVGDVICGFEVLEIRPFPLVGAELVLFEHQKTGAKALYVANEDTDRTFQLTFRTRPSDDTGLPHVFEHATLFGSEKYPSSSLFFNISYQTYNTYVNANTTDACTNYPSASLSEEQLLRLADWYVDACFHPLIMTDESIFKTQAWHYDLPALDGEMTYEGVVYSEMQGAMTLSRAALSNANRVTFPGAYLSYNQGGLPEVIPEMTWESVKEFHGKYYHPSNCLAILYGQIDNYAAFLALLDEEFSQYEKAEITFEDADYAPIAEPVVAEYAYPVAEGTDVANQSVLYYYILCPGMKGNQEQELLVDHLCSLLNETSSVLSQSFKKAFPSGSFSCGREVAGPDDAIVFVASNMNRGDAEAFKALVDEALKNVAENGFPQEMVDAAMTSLNISSKLAPESGTPAEGVVYSIAYDYAVTGNPFHYAESNASLSKLDEENQQGLLKNAAQWLADASLYTLTTTYPAPGEKEKQDAALKEKLAAIKAGMSQEELQAIVDETNAAPKEEDTTELMAQIKAVSVESLPEEIKTYPVDDFTDGNGIRHIDVTAGVDGIGYAGIYLDAAALPQEDIHWMRLFTRLLGQLDTDAHTKEELDVLISRYLYDKTIGVAVNSMADGTVHPYLVAEWYAMDDDLAQGYDLMYELLYHTQFTDTQKLLERVQAQKAAVRSTINSSPYQVMEYRGFAADNLFARYYAYMNYLEYYSFLEQLEQSLTENPEEVVRHFQTVQAFFANSAGAVATFAGNENSIQVNRPLADGFLAKLDYQAREPMEYDLPVPSKREALIIDSNIQFNNVVATMKDLGLEDNDLSLNVVANLVSDQLLVPLLRDQMGVYTPWNGNFLDLGFYLITYRDPNLADTFDVYAALPEMIAQLDVDQDTLDGYIMNIYSGLAKPEGELTGAVTAISNALTGRDQERMLDYMKQIKAVTPDAVHAAAEIYQKAWDNGAHTTAGSAAAINANAELFDVILNPFGAVDASQVTLNDVTEGSEYYEAVRFVFENSLMAPKAEDAFGVDEPANVGDLVGALYVIIGGSPNAPEEAVEYLGQFGIVPEGVDASTTLTNGMSDAIFVNFGAAVGLSLEADAPNETTDQPITRGALAEQIQMLMMYLQ